MPVYKVKLYQSFVQIETKVVFVKAGSRDILEEAIGKNETDLFFVDSQDDWEEVDSEVTDTAHSIEEESEGDACDIDLTENS